MFPLIEVLKTRCVATRIWAAGALGRMGPAAAAALPALRKLARAENPAVRRAARKAIRQIGRPESPPPGEAARPGPAGRWGRFTSALRSALGGVHS